jgi:colanic acid/amylovoran biosynthesis glycosyltransferase
MNKPVVAHLNKQFFARSETFIYFYISQIKKFRSICYGWRNPINLDLFPFPKADCYSSESYYSKLGWFLRAGIKKLFNQFIDKRVFIESFRERGIDLIHAHFGPVGWWSLELKRILGLPLITSFYGYDLGDKLHELREWTSKRQELFEEGDLFLVEGPYMKNRMISKGCPEEKLQLQRIAIPVDRIPYKSRRVIKKRNVRFLFAGRFVEKKGIPDLLASFKQLVVDGEEVELRLIGDGPIMPLVRDYINHNGLEEKVHLMGSMNYQDYMNEMANADLFIHPSCTASNGDTEGGAPTTILEAQACGLPVLSTTHADIPNIVLPGSSAILVSEHKVDDLTKAAKYLLHHSEEWEPMGKAGRQFVETKHDIKREVKNLEIKYGNLLEKRFRNA